MFKALRIISEREPTELNLNKPNLHYIYINILDPLYNRDRVSDRKGTFLS